MRYITRGYEMRGTLASGQIINADGKNDRKFAP